MADENEEVRIKDLTETVCKGFMALDGDVTGKMDVDTIFNNFAGEFIDNVTEAKAGGLYMHAGSLYEAKENYIGVWDSSKFIAKNTGSLFYGLSVGVGDTAAGRTTKDYSVQIKSNVLGTPNRCAVYDPDLETFSYTSSSSWTTYLVDAKRLRRVDVVAGSGTYTTMLIPCVLWLDENKEVIDVQYGNIDTSVAVLKRMNQDVFAPAGAVYALVNRYVSGVSDLKNNYLYFVKDFTEIGVEKKTLDATQDGAYFTVIDSVVSVGNSVNWKITKVSVENLKRIITYAGTAGVNNFPPVAFFKGDEISTDNFISTFYEQPGSQAQVSKSDIEIQIPPGATFAAINCLKTSETADCGAYYRIEDINDVIKFDSLFVVVSKDGKGDFTSINDAVQSVPNDSTIIVMPGVYEENVRAFTKRINIIGVNKKTCILVSYDGRYTNPALEIAAGMVKNMSIMSLFDETKTQLTGDENVRAYAVHVENQQGQSTAVAEGHSLIFENCIFKSDFFPAIGCGGFVDWEFRIENCELTNNQSSEISPPIYSGTLGALYVHSQIGSHEGNGNIVVKNNILRCINYANALCMYDLQNANKTLSFTFVGNALVSTAGLTDNIFWRGITTPFGGTLSKNSDSWNNSNTQLD